MRTVTFGAACSLDGFIARPDHSVDWLRWSKDVGAITNAFWKTIDTVVMGRKTYTVAAKSGGGGYPGVRNYVFSRTLKQADHPKVEVIADDAATFVAALKKTRGKGICVMGGGELASDLFNAGLIDEVGLNIHPTVLGSGIPMFPRVQGSLDLELVENRLLEGGCVYVLYRVKIARRYSKRKPRGKAASRDRVARFGELRSVQPRPATVASSYDAIADDWHRSRRESQFRERPWIEELIAPLPGSARVLDLGCGGGEPISKFLATSGFKVVGVDTSARLLAHARAAVPEATFVLGDMRTVDLDGTFDALVAWDSIFHLPRADHADLFTRVRGWLRPGGRLLVSLGGSDDAGFTSEMYGQTFYYSGHDRQTALALLREAGFEIEHWEVDDPSSRGHIAIIAERST